MALLVFTFGIAITNGTMEYITGTSHWGDPDFENLMQWFGTLNSSILSLYQGMSGGKDWGEYYDVIMILSGSYQVLFLLFISFSTLAVVNIVTGIFVDSAFQCSRQDRESLVSEEILNREKYLKDLKDVFEEMDEDGT
eukprot:CAMPEP_0206607800 /NCGR_PEP_ID=MMETSP0325_2-20121206/52478_1 /ASSEMBLY_ACC=CAM_ASM_000347 /TAXON_ID=2866 /ORGANISM="Crypthecodinium cohnii, Strain Seligo" /LENGTH=137 /DNA_ID=CAMNT_0054125107 /DNA_START=26 /DNA_END=435 /DNA_ORIENTATION=-